MFRFENPLALLLLLLPLAWLVWRLIGRSVDKPALYFSDLRLVRRLPTGWRVGWSWLPDTLRMMGWVFLVIILARPQSGQQREVIRGEGIDIVIALDISSSMSAEDISPSRLEGAKVQIERFIQGRTFDRVGLVVFAAEAYHYVPPTLDYSLYTERLQDVLLVNDYGLDAAGTAIGTGIASAVNMLRTSDAQSQIIILLTDGSNNSGNVNPLDAARAASALGVRIYAIGVGRAAADDNVIGSFDEGTLQSIAEISDGLYFQVSDNLGLQRTYEQIDALERSDIEQQIFVNWREQSQVLMICALCCLLLEQLLRQTAFQAVP